MVERRDESRGVDRRSVLAGGAAAAASAALGGIGGAATGGTTAAGAPGHGEFELAERSLADLARGLELRRWSSEQLVELYLERIAAVDRGPEGTNAIAELNPDAPAIAAERDRERRAGRVRGPLHGIPIVVKDNIDTGDRMRTTAGSLALAESIAARDAHVVERLREAGAVLLAKTNLSEWANIRSSHSTSGWSGRGGQVRNPYALDRNPCGSSSGSGVAPSTSLAAAAVGTETDGSVICPAAMCGIAGLKPTVGLVSRIGIVPIAHSQDTAGPMARSVDDVAILLGAMTGTDLRDPATAASADRREGDYRRSFGPDALRGARLGIVRDYFGWHEEITRQFPAVLDALRELGAELVDPVELPHRRELGQAEWEVLLYELKHDLNLYLAGLPDGDQPRTLAELIEWNRLHAELEMPWFGQDSFEEAEAKGPLTDRKYEEALANCRRLARDELLDPLFGGEKPLDALVSPTTGPAFLVDWVNGDAYGGSITGPAAVAGYPHLTVPAGFVHGLPWGLSWLGPAWSEARLLAYGDAFERATGARRPPRFLPTLPLAG
ncbi:MAG TPA: amidase [Thermoanaerobaculia bacterium]